MFLVGEGEEFAVAFAVAEGYQLVFISVGMAGKETVDLLLTLTVVADEITGYNAVYGLQFGAEEFNAGTVGEEGAHPYRRAC